MTNVHRIRPRQTTRRSFVKLAAASTLLAGSADLKKTWAQTSAARPLLGDLPNLDGELLFGDADRQAIAIDYGGNVRRSPVAVLRPRSTDDIMRMVGYANKHGLKIAMRGRGHSQYGQSQVERGIVIDSNTLNTVRLLGNDAVDAQPGATWGDVAQAALAQSRVPPVMVDCDGAERGRHTQRRRDRETGFRYGAQVDNVFELDVVTGAGEFVTCSSDRNSELFHMTLAGLGQCGIIVRAQLRLVQASKFLATRTLVYDDLDTFLSDQARLTTVDVVGLLNGTPSGIKTDVSASSCLPEVSSRRRRRRSPASLDDRTAFRFRTSADDRALLESSRPSNG